MASRDANTEISLGLGDLYLIARRRFWWFTIPATVGLVGSLARALVLPPEYEAEATVAVEPQGIPPTIAESTVVADTETRYDNLTRQILARDNMSAVIDEFALYEADDRTREEQIEELRDRITIAPLPPAIVDPRKEIELTSFRIAFRWGDPKTAARVATRLTRDFLSANLKDRSTIAEGTAEFVAAELEKARALLTDYGQQITDYKENFQGELPEQLLMNRERLERSRMDLASAEQKLGEAQNQSQLIRQEVAELRASIGTTEDDPGRRKNLLELNLQTMLAKGMTEKHPDIVHTRTEIAALEEILSEAAVNPAPASRDEIRLRDELRKYEVNANVYAAEIERLKAEIAEYDQRIENTPRRAAELGHLEKTYENLNEAIRALQLKKVEADMGKNVELAQKGERFRVMESAVEPAVPTSPNRLLWFVAGTLLGILGGFICLVVREMIDQSFHTVSDLQTTLGLPVLAAVPVIELETDATGRRRRRFWGTSSALVLIGMLLSGALYLYYAGFEGASLPRSVEVERVAESVDV